MAVSCDPQDLITASNQYCCITNNAPVSEAVKLYFLAKIAGLDGLTIDELLERSKCYLSCIPEGAVKPVQTYLLCQAANGGAAPTECEAQEGANSPEGAATPDFIGQLYHETGDDTYWRSTGLTNADWVIIVQPGLVWSGTTVTTWKQTDAGANTDIDVTPDTAVTIVSLPRLQTATTELSFANQVSLTKIDCPALTSVGTLTMPGCSTLTNLNLPLLQTVTGFDVDIQGSTLLTSLSLPNLTSVGRHINFQSCPNLTSINLNSLATVGDDFKGTVCGISILSLPVLVSVAQDFLMRTCTALTSVSCPSLTTVNGGTFLLDGCTSLTTVSFPVWNPKNGQYIDFSVCALTAASVNHILARGIANAGFVSGTMDLSGGTNAAPTGQGIVDAAALVLRGVTIATN